MNNKFTPAPWHIIYLYNNKIDPIVQRGMSGGFAISDNNKERANADAKLIASAPEMYEAIKTLLKEGLIWNGERLAYTMIYPEAIWELEELIKKIDGEDDE